MKPAHWFIVVVVCVTLAIMLPLALLTRVEWGVGV
jgi:hypothetical protein